jgi:hypothetical protein
LPLKVPSYSTWTSRLSGDDLPFLRERETVRNEAALPVGRDAPIERVARIAPRLTSNVRSQD